jgi:Mg2+ and Co2+ transporter CorA
MSRSGQTGGRRSQEAVSPDYSKGPGSMKLTLSIVGVLLLLMGAVWALQGLNVLPGEFMAGQTRWVVNGVIAMAIGLVLIAVSRRRERR